jgi:hypothetical protein
MLPTLLNPQGALRALVLFTLLAAASLAALLHWPMAPRAWVDLLRYLPYPAWLLPTLLVWLVAWAAGWRWGLLASLAPAIVLTGVMGWTWGAPEAGRQPLRFMTYNIKAYRAHDRPYGFILLADELRRWDADVVVMQDATLEKGPLHRLPEELREALPQHQLHRHDQYVVASRLPLAGCRSRPGDRGSRGPGGREGPVGTPAGDRRSLPAARRRRALTADAPAPAGAAEHLVGTPRPATSRLVSLAMQPSRVCWCEKFQDLAQFSGSGPMRSWWPRMAEPSVLLVQALHVVSVCGANAVPSAREPVSMSCSLGVSPRPLTTATFLVERGGLADVVAVVQVGQVARDQLALGVEPGAGADAVACMDRRRAGGRGGRREGAGHAEVGAPGLAAGTGRRGQLLAMRVGAGQAAQVGALAAADAGDEEAHRAAGRTMVIARIATTTPSEASTGILRRRSAASWCR